jgi:hypothetical protein
MPKLKERRLRSPCITVGCEHLTAAKDCLCRSCRQEHDVAATNQQAERELCSSLDHEQDYISSPVGRSRSQYHGDIDRDDV